MARMKLTENHPTYKKFSELCAKAEELGLHLAFFNAGACVLTDDESKQEFLINEVDDGQVIEEFPPTFDYRITFEKQ